MISVGIFSESRQLPDQDGAVGHRGGLHAGKPSCRRCLRAEIDHLDPSLHVRPRRLGYCDLHQRHRPGWRLLSRPDPVLVGAVDGVRVQCGVVLLRLCTYVDLSRTLSERAQSLELHLQVCVRTCVHACVRGRFPVRACVSACVSSKTNIALA